MVHFVDLAFDSHKSCARLFADDFYQHAFTPPPIELAVENLFPWTEIELAASDGHNHLAPHHLSLYVRIGIVFAGVIVAVLLDRFVRREFFEPYRVVMVQSRFVIVDEHRRGNMHGVDQCQSFFDAALADAFLDLICNIHKRHPRRRIEPQLFPIAFHTYSLTRLISLSGIYTDNKLKERSVHASSD